MKPRVTVVDYGLGNLFSVARALEQVGAEGRFTDSAGEVESAERLILPGVGAFRNGMQGLRSRSLVGPLRRYAASGRPFLGICLGMQLMLEWSAEFGREEGLGVLKGGVVAIPAVGADGRAHKVPHIGWNELRPAGEWQGSVLESTAAGTAVYFVHSYACEPAERSDRLADCHYDGIAVCAAVRRANVGGVQFHPEKSGAAGLRILRRFVAFA